MLKDRKINNGDVIVVFDMEWNQPIGGVEYDFDVSSLCGEIIEIGAVRYVYSEGKLRSAGVFSCDIKPRMYRKLHYHVKKVTHKTNADLLKGIPFEEAYAKFIRFCGGKCILAGWGNSDPDMLKTNLKFFGMDDKLGMDFLDIQQVFAVFALQRGEQKSVEYAVDHYNIAKVEEFHGATADAKYTGEILRQIFKRNDPSEVTKAMEYTLTDPDVKSEFTCVGAEAEKAGDAFLLLDNFAACCPVCGSPFRGETDFFRIRKSKYAMLSCPEHGDFYCRVRVKKNRNGKYYAAALLRLATTNDLFLLKAKKEEYERYGEKGAPSAKESEQSPTSES